MNIISAQLGVSRQNQRNGPSPKETDVLKGLTPQIVILRKIGLPKSSMMFGWRPL
jgi:hypothetical protein